MKKFRLLLGFIAIACAGKAQIPWGKYSQSYIDDEKKQPQLIAAILSGNNSFWYTDPDDALRDAVRKDSAFMENRPSSFVTINSFDTANAHFFVRDAGKHSLEYRVLVDGAEPMVQWSALTMQANDSLKAQSTLKDLWYVGGYKAPIGHYLVIDLREKNQNNIISTSIVNWRPIRPLLYNIYTVAELNEFLKRLSHPDGYYLSQKEIEKWRDKYGPENLDFATSLPKKLITSAEDNRLIFVLRADIRNKEQLEYELVRDGKIIRPWGANDFDNNFIWLNYMLPGEYTLRVRFSAQPANTMEYNFKVLAPPGPTTAYIIGISSLAAAFLALAIVIALYIRQKRKTITATRQRERLELEMKGVKSQLNPHFVFNSLNSIQGLVNTGRIKEANEYIALFAKIMRETLTLADIDHAPLQKEIDYLDAYLRLEQLRFNFAYQIHTDDVLNTNEVNFPTLLLQPLVENAVKHGVANKKDGLIVVTFSKQLNDLSVTISDNGNGFNNDKQREGYGLHLTNQRIQLLNHAAGRQLVSMQINSDEKEGTALRLTFKDWINETKNNIDR